MRIISKIVFIVALLLPLASQAKECFVKDGGNKVVCDDIVIRQKNGRYYVTQDGETVEYRQKMIGGNTSKFIGDGNVVTIRTPNVTINDTTYRCWNRNGKVTCIKK